MMNRKYRIERFLFLAALLVVVPLVSLAQERIFELTPESFKSRIVIEDGVPFERVFPSLRLERISTRITSYKDLYSPDLKRWSFGWNTDGFLIVEGKKTFIQKQPGMEIFSPLRATPDRKKGLLDYGSSKFAVVYLDDVSITILPAITRKNTSVISWYWKTNDSLIGLANEFLPEMLKPNNGRVEDIYPEKVFLFLYDLDDSRLYLLNLPKIRRGKVIRLEGITPKGGLVLAEVPPENAEPNTEPRRVLGVFDIAPPRSESK
jgi:hypothetical protein